MVSEPASSASPPHGDVCWEGSTQKEAETPRTLRENQHLLIHFPVLSCEGKKHYLIQ